MSRGRLGSSRSRTSCGWHCRVLGALAQCVIVGEVLVHLVKVHLDGVTLMADVHLLVVPGVGALAQRVVVGEVSCQSAAIDADCVVLAVVARRDVADHHLVVVVLTIVIVLSVSVAVTIVVMTVFVIFVRIVVIVVVVLRM